MNASGRNPVIPALLSILPIGCSSVGNYCASRALDLWDIVPIAAEYGYGIEASVRVTPWFHTSFFGHNAEAFGMALGRWGPRWRTNGLGIVIATREEGTTAGRSWPGGPDRRYRLGPGWRVSGNTAFFFPGPFEPCSRPVKLPPPYGYIDSAIHIFAGVVGVRAGVAPLQAVDFVCGLFTVDLFGDDVGVEEREEVAPEDEATCQTAEDDAKEAGRDPPP